MPGYRYPESQGITVDELSDVNRNTRGSVASSVVKQGNPGVDVSNSKLTAIPIELFQRPDISNIRWMDASYNEIPEIPPQLSKITCITSLNFDNNFVADIGGTLVGLTKLNKLLLSNNQIKDFSPSLIQMSHLTELSLSNNKISVLPDNLGDLSNIACLYISHNTLQHLPQSIGQLRHLRILDVRYNNLTSLPDSVEGLCSLERLQAYCNQLVSLPEGIGSCSRLRVLRISSNKLSDLPLSMGRLGALETLDLHNNQLTRLPECVCELAGLIELHVGDNEITYFDDNISGLKRLQTLKANSNLLQCLPTFIDSLTSIRYLHVRNNNIRTIPETLHELPQLQVFDAKNNPIHFPPREVWERGLQSIKGFFEEMKRSGSSRSSRLKITVLGSEGAGKTSFIRCLTEGSAPTDVDPTLGINVTRWIPVEDPNMAFVLWDHSGNVLYEPTHQYFFSPGSLVFLVVNLATYELANDLSYEHHVGKYIAMLRKFGGESVIQIVATHHDVCQASHVSLVCEEIVKHIQSDVNKITKNFDSRIKEALEMTELFKSYQRSHNHADIAPCSQPSPLSPSASEEPVHDVIGFIEKIKLSQPKFLSNIPKVCGVGDMAGIKDFRRILFKLTQDKKRYPTVELLLPKSWLGLDEEIKTLREQSTVPVIPLDNLIQIAQKKDPEFKEKDIQEALLYLHMTGELLHFYSIPGLRSYVFISPIWLINTITCVIQPSNITDNITTETIRAAWSHLSLSADQYNLLQTLATAFGLWYNDGDNFIIPTLISETTKNSEIVENVSMIRGITAGDPYTQIEFDTLPVNEYQIVNKFVFPFDIPKGLMGRIIVKCRKHCTEYEYLSPRCIAATKQGVTIVLVNTHAGNNVLTLCARAAKDKLLTMWRVILSFLFEIEELLSQWSGLLFYRYLVCPHCFLTNEPTPFHFLGEWYTANVNRLPEIVKIACPVARGAVRVHLKLLYPPRNAHLQPAQVSESEIQMIAATLADHWIALAKILGLAEDDIAGIAEGGGCDDSEETLSAETLTTTMLNLWVEKRKELATSEELQLAVKTLHKLHIGDGGCDDEGTERTETMTMNSLTPKVAVNL